MCWNNIHAGDRHRRCDAVSMCWNNINTGDRHRHCDAISMCWNNIHGGDRHRHRHAVGMCWSKMCDGEIQECARFAQNKQEYLDIPMPNLIKLNVIPP